MSAFKEPPDAVYMQQGALAYLPKNRQFVQPYLAENELEALLKTKRKGRVFVGDMTDLFAEWVPDEWLDRLFAVMALRPDLTFQLLTKRPERMREHISVGAESGAHRRPMDFAWLESIVQQCQDAGVPVFVKQASALHPGQQGDIPDALWALKQFPQER